MKHRIVNIVLGGFMLLASALAVALKPLPVTSNQQHQKKIGEHIPLSFGTWSAIPGNAIVIADPQQQEVLDGIYSEVISRTYLDSQTGKAIMLMVAYGADQSKQSQIHLPEVCYPAQGFQIRSRKQGDLRADTATIPVTRMIAVSEQRSEPITYWVRIGGRIVRGSIEQKLAIVAEGLTGKRADGVLFRVSSVGHEPEGEYAAHELFVKSLLSAMDRSALTTLTGTLN